jgi:hypothetical protein
MAIKMTHPKRLTGSILGILLAITLTAPAFAGTDEQDGLAVPSAAPTALPAPTVDPDSLPDEGTLGVEWTFNAVQGVEWTSLPASPSQ